MSNSDQNKYKILYIAKNIPVQGVLPSRVVIDIAHQISDFAQVQFVYPNEIVPFGLHYLKKYKPFYKLKPWIYEGFMVTVLNYPRLPLNNQAFAFWSHLTKKSITFYTQKGPFDLIHAHYLLPDGYLAYLFGKQFNIPYVVTIRNSDIILLKKYTKGNTDLRKAEAVIYNAARILCLNTSYQDFINNMFGINSEIIPHGIEEEAYASDESSPNIVRIITVSSAIKRKNIDWIIESVLNYNGSKNIELLIVGDGTLIGELKKMAGNDPRIYFTGKIPRNEVLKLLRKSDIFVLPSYNETYGLTYVEAAAAHNAIIGLKNEGVWGIFKEDKEMLFCSNKNEFIQKLHFLIGHPDQVYSLKEAAFERAKLLNWRSIKEQYNKLYKTVIDISADGKEL